MVTLGSPCILPCTRDGAFRRIAEKPIFGPSANRRAGESSLLHSWRARMIGERPALGETVPGSIVLAETRMSNSPVVPGSMISGIDLDRHRKCLNGLRETVKRSETDPPVCEEGGHAPARLDRLVVHHECLVKPTKVNKGDTAVIEGLRVKGVKSQDSPVRGERLGMSSQGIEGVAEEKVRLDVPRGKAENLLKCSGCLGELGEVIEDSPLHEPDIGVERRDSDGGRAAVECLSEAAPRIESDGPE